jgi:hypothetical protein
LTAELYRRSCAHAQVLEYAQKDTSWADRDKLYYMAITLPGYGILAIALLQSGSHLRSGTERGDCKFWYERINELELYHEDEEARKKLERELRARKFRVHMHKQFWNKCTMVCEPVNYKQCSLHLPSSCAAACCSTAPRAGRADRSHHC